MMGGTIFCAIADVSYGKAEVPDAARFSNLLLTIGRYHQTVQALCFHQNNALELRSVDPTKRVCLLGRGSPIERNGRRMTDKGQIFELLLAI